MFTLFTVLESKAITLNRNLKNIILFHTSLWFLLNHSLIVLRAMIAAGSFGKPKKEKKWQINKRHIFLLYIRKQKSGLFFFLFFKIFWNYNWSTPFFTDLYKGFRHYLLHFPQLNKLKIGTKMLYWIFFLTLVKQSPLLKRRRNNRELYMCHTGQASIQHIHHSNKY